MFLKAGMMRVFSKDACSTDNEKKFTEECYRILSMMMAECSKEFEKLPVIMYSDLLRNILYSGVGADSERNVMIRRNNE